MVNSPLIRPAISWGGSFGGDTLNSHDHSDLLIPFGSRHQTFEFSGRVFSPILFTIPKGHPPTGRPGPPTKHPGHQVDIGDIGDGDMWLEIIFSWKIKLLDVNWGSPVRQNQKSEGW